MLGRSRWITWALLASGALNFVLLVVLVVVAATRGGGGSEEGGVKVEYDGSTFLVGIKDAFWSDYEFERWRASEGKKAFVVVYTYTNLGPREGGFSFGRPEVRTAKGHFFPGSNLDLFAPFGDKRKNGVGWWPQVSEKIEGTSEEALVFDVPAGEVPTELRTNVHNFRLVNRPFGFRIYSDVFGFLPESSEQAVPALIEELGAMKPGMFVHSADVPDWKTCKAAAIVLGKIGPDAKDAIPALKKLIEEDYHPGRFGNPYGDAAVAAQEALAKIVPTR